MQERQDGRVAFIALVLTLGLFVFLGVLARSFWVPVSCFAGVVLLSRAGYLGAKGSRGAFVVLAIPGMALVGAAALGSGFAGRWLWTLIGLLLALNLGMAGGALKRANARGTGAFAILLGSVCAVVGILGPWFLHGSSIAVTSWTALLATSGFDVGRGLEAVKAFLSIRSPWGLLYLTVLCFLGTLLRKKRWDYLLSFAAILAAVGIAAGASPKVAPAVLHVFSSSPVVLMKDLLLTVGANLGSPARGPFLAGVLLPVLLLPAIREALRAGRAIQEANAVGQLLGSTMGVLVARRVGGVGPLSAIATIISRGVPFGLAIALWMALRELSGAGQVIPYEWIPDITRPSWAPLWQIRYVGVGLIIGAMNFAFIGVRANRGLFGPMSRHPLLVFLAPVLLSLVTPAGVMLFIGPMCWTWQMETLLLLVHWKPAPAPVVEKAPPAPPPARALPPFPPVSAPYIPSVFANDSAPLVPAEPDMLLFRHEAPIVDLIAMEPGGFVGIDSLGKLFRARGGRTEEIVRLDVASPARLAALSGDRVAVVEWDGRIRIVSLSGPDTAPVREIRTSGEIHHHAFNGYGTIMAHAGDTGRISLSVLSSGQERTLADGLGAVSALVYSGDSSKLAVGTREGDVHLIDMTTRKPVAKLASRMPPPFGVVALAEGPGPRWVVAHENDFLACWTGDGVLEQSQKMRGDISCLTVDASAGKIAFASKEGRVYVVSPDLRITFVVPETEQEGVVRLTFVENGAAIVSAAADGTVHRVEL